MKIGIIGYGYVGSAVAASFMHKDILINDPAHPSSSIEQLKAECSAIFVCVPTPQADSGECDTSILESVISSLKGYPGIVIVKSTANPGLFGHLEATSGLQLAHVPEFLTQSRAQFDYLNPHKIVVGCREELRRAVADILMYSNINFERVRIEYCSITEASMFKYLANTMLAMKVIINNEFADICDSYCVDYEKVAEIAKTDPRLGNTHWSVPGPDGKRGFGGACFPKDTAALEYMAKKVAVETTMLSTAISTNKKYR